MASPTVHHINHNKLDNRVENLCWMSAFCNNQEGHGVRTKVIDRTGERLFDSQKTASAYIGRYEDYIAECIREGYKVTNSEGEEVEIWIFSESDWIKYESSVPLNKHKCRISISGNVTEFSSFWKCDEFLNKPKGYTSNAVSNSWPLLGIGEDFYLYDMSTSQYVLYVPTKIKKKASTSCKLTWPSGYSEIYRSISSAARAIGRDSEYVRLKIRDSKEILDSYGNPVIATLVD